MLLSLNYHIISSNYATCNSSTVLHWINYRPTLDHFSNKAASIPTLRLYIESSAYSSQASVGRLGHNGASARSYLHSSKLTAFAAWESPTLAANEKVLNVDGDRPALASSQCCLPMYPARRTVPAAHVYRPRIPRSHSEAAECEYEVRCDGWSSPCCGEGEKACLREIVRRRMD